MATASYHRESVRAYQRPDGAPQASFADHIAVRWGDAVWLIARLVLGGLFIMGSFQKFSGLDAFTGTLVQGGFPQGIAAWLAPVAAGVELLVGIGITFGFLTRYAALLAFAFVVAATLTSHRFWDFEGQEQMMQMIHFNKNLMILAGLAFLFVCGDRRYSIDHWRTRA
jgi:putative oxidoreductase